MIVKHRFFTLTSAAALSLALGQASAQTEAAPAADKTPAPPSQVESTATPNAAAGGAQTLREKMQQRYAAAMAEREKRYEEARQRAAEMGMEMPETPAWTPYGPYPYGPFGNMPDMPDMPDAMGMPEGLPAPLATMTPEERKTLREQRWEEMRARAAEQGMEFPETPPWEAAEQRRQEMLERYNEYKAIIEAMTDEQKEAISALFGRARTTMSPYGMPGYGRCGGCRQKMYPHMRRGMGMMPYYPPQMKPMPSEPASEDSPPAANPNQPPAAAEPAG